MAAPTIQELDQVSIFRSRIIDLGLEHEQLHDQHLLRWIRAREGDLSKAEDMIRRHITWRKNNSIAPSLFDWRPSDFLRDTYRAKFCGYDDSGCPILLFTFGLWDLRPAVGRGEKENLTKYKDQCLLKIMRLMELFDSQRKSHPGLSSYPEKITQFNCICDWTDYSMWYIMNKDVVEVILEAAKSFEANWPETLKAAYNVNCPKVFDILFRLVKPFLSERTLSKIFIYDSNEPKWKNDILSALPANQVPRRYGGTRDRIWELNDLNISLDQDGTFFSEIFEDLDEPREEKEGYKKVQVAAFDKLSIPISISSPQTKLSWKVAVSSDSDDDMIDLAIYSENGGNCGRKMWTERRQVKDDKGEVECSEVGNYWIIFTNSAVALNEPKTVYYKLALDIPEK